MNKRFFLGSPSLKMVSQQFFTKELNCWDFNGMKSFSLKKTILEDFSTTVFSQFFCHQGKKVSMGFSSLRLALHRFSKKKTVQNIFSLQEICSLRFLVIEVGFHNFLFNQSTFSMEFPSTIFFQGLHRWKLNFKASRTVRKGFQGFLTEEVELHG